MMRHYYLVQFTIAIINMVMAYLPYASKWLQPNNPLNVLVAGFCLGMAFYRYCEQRVRDDY